ncbi:MAG: biotin/lipoyl-binding protein [Candidatus Omnitrophica bacterium]|jgi:pyruvate dehydrogenase E2 component (dihydrolipoamide acetyltransferase)|nr:biotin/lipoyl-binding protein [Candidatus Omnitrophota bacterium]MDD5310665.1 biotin/lipoyl-binding protein [Candidatus Omnitrophota bacterium]MDD5545669.1 biotin/lipoyl-binding protein [Candidatus Omnitrophota bacterium]
MAKVILPEVGEGAREATISYWHFEEGDRIEEGEDLVEIATDKSAINVPAPCSGVLTEVYFEEGDIVEVGEVLANIEEEEALFEEEE